VRDCNTEKSALFPPSPYLHTKPQYPLRGLILTKFCDWPTGNDVCTRTQLSILACPSSESEETASIPLCYRPSRYDEAPTPLLPTVLVPSFFPLLLHAVPTSHLLRETAICLRFRRVGCFFCWGGFVLRRFWFGVLWGCWLWLVWGAGGGGFLLLLSGFLGHANSHAQRLFSSSKAVRAPSNRWTKPVTSSPSLIAPVPLLFAEHEVDRMTAHSGFSEASSGLCLPHAT